MSSNLIPSGLLSLFSHLCWLCFSLQSWKNKSTSAWLLLRVLRLLTGSWKSSHCKVRNNLHSLGRPSFEASPKPDPPCHTNPHSSQLFCSSEAAQLGSLLSPAFLELRRWTSSQSSIILKLLYICPPPRSLEVTSGAVHRSDT